MKKLFFISLFVIVGTIFFPYYASAQTKSKSLQQKLFKSSLPERFIVEPDPDNPFQGTWFYLVNPREYGRSIFVIEGTTAKTYTIESATKGWVEGTTYYNVDTNPEFRLSEDKNILQQMIITYGPDNSVKSSKLSSTYERY